MLNFLKQIFQKEEILEIEEVKIDDLIDWLDNKVSNLDFKEEIVEFFNKVKDKKWILDEKINTLENAEINEKEKDKVDEKVKSIVLGHKDNYIKEMKRFLENLEIPEETDLWRLIKFNDILNNSLDELSKKTAKSYQAAQHLFFKQVEEVFKAVGEVNLLVKNFDKKLEKKGLKKIKDMQEKIRFLQEEKRKKERLEDDLKWKETKLNRCSESKEKQEEEIVELRNCEEYQELMVLKGEEEKINDLTKEKNDEIHLFFSKLGRALRKYEKITLEVKVVREYLEDAVKAFFNDKELKIVNVLEGLRKSIEKGEVELDEKQKENAFELIEKAKKGYLKELSVGGEEIQKKVSEIKTRLRAYTADKLIEEAEYKSEHFEEQIVLMEREIDELKVRFQSLGGEKLEEDLKGLAKDVLKVEVRLI